MKTFGASVLPAPCNEYAGARASTWFLALYTAASMARSLVHILAPDGGARSIAGMDVSGAGGANLVALFAQWGIVQLLLAVVSGVVLLRYRALVPLLLLVAFCEQLGRLALGQWKPVVSTHTPPGAIGTRVLLPLTLVFFVLSLVRRSRDAGG